MFKYFLVWLAVICAGVANGQKSEIFQKNGAAIDGYDVVSFFNEHKPVRGNPEFTLEWSGAKWYFSSADHLDSFRSDPLRYAPQYGGYCAYGTAEGHKAPTQASTWTIIDEKLYFNYNSKVKELWSKDTPEYIRKANLNWEKIKHSE